MRLKNTLKLSVIIPIYNDEKYINRCLLSIMAAQMEDYEIILIDDGSNDESLSICTAWEKKFSEIRLIHTPNMGVSHARNIGIDAANGKWMVFIDADDYIFSHYFKKLTTLLNDKTDYILFSYLENKHGKIAQHNDMFFEKSNDIKYTSMQEALKLIFEAKEVQGYVWNKVFKRQIVQQHQIYFNEELMYNEDLLFCYEYLQYTNQIIYIKNYLYCYVKNEGTAVTGKVNDAIVDGLKSFKYMLRVKSKLPEISYQYIHVAYMYMNCYLLKSALKRGYTHIQLIENIRMNIISEKFKYLRIYNYEVKLLTILIRIMPEWLFYCFYRCFPSGI